MTRQRRRAAAWMLAAIVLVVVAFGRGGGRAAPPPPRVQVVVAARPLEADRPIRAGDLAIRRIPAAAVNRDQLTDPAAAVGRRLAVPLSAGASVMAAELVSGGVVSGGRDVAIRLDDLAGLPAEAMAGAHADLYLTTPGRLGTTRAVLRDVLVVAASRSGGGSVATLRLPASLVTAAIAAEAAGQLRLVAVAARGPDG